MSTMPRDEVVAGTLAEYRLFSELVRSLSAERDPALGDGVRASVHMMALELRRRNWGPAALALDGIESLDVGAGGKEITGDPYEFVMAATGRGNPGALGLDETVNVYR